MSLLKTGDKLEVTFDSPEAKGRVILERGIYGVYVVFPDLVDGDQEQTALLDFFYASEKGKKLHPGAVAAVHVWTKEAPVDDSVVKVIYYKDKKTEVEVS